MPFKSEKQRRFMYATAAGHTDAPPSVGKKFLRHTKGQRVGHLVGKPKRQR